MDHTRLARIALRQNGLFTRTQAHTCGATPTQIRRRVESGEWLLLFGSVLATAGTVMTPRVTDRAAQLAVPGSVAAGPSAARLWRLALPAGIELPRAPRLVVARRRRPVPGIAIERAELGPRDAARVDGVPATTIDRTVFDCLRLLAEADAQRLLDRALQQRWTTMASLIDRLHGFTGRHGVNRLRHLVRAVADGSRSAAERRATQILRSAGIRGGVVNQAIHDERGLIGVGDVVFESARVVLELDGWAFHSADEAFQRDRERQNRLVNAGWLVLRFTWHDLVHRPDHVVATVRAALSGRARPA